MVAAGKMTTREMNAAFIDNAAISVGMLGGAKIGAAPGSAYPGIGTVIGTLIGSLIGCTCAVVYNVGKKRLISFCVDTGFTCFGLVEQNYELPPDVLEKLGINTTSIPTIEIPQITIPQIEIPQIHINTVEVETVDLVFVRRGVIGVNKIGYI